MKKERKENSIFTFQSCTYNIDTLTLYHVPAGRFVLSIPVTPSTFRRLCMPVLQNGWGGNFSLHSWALPSNRLLQLVIHREEPGKGRLGVHSSTPLALVLSWFCASSLRTGSFSTSLDLPQWSRVFYPPSEAADLCLKSVSVSTSQSPALPPWQWTSFLYHCKVLELGRFLPPLPMADVFFLLAMMVRGGGFLFHSQWQLTLSWEQGVRGFSVPSLVAANFCLGLRAGFPFLSFADR